VVIIGGGITGLSSAYRLAEAGQKVIVLEKGNLAWEASGRAHGMLSPRGDDPYEMRLSKEAFDIWPTLDEELGSPTEWVGEGRLWLSFDAQSAERLQNTQRMWSANGIPIEVVDRSEVRELVPCVGDHVHNGIYSTRGGHANPQRTAQAYAWAFQARGGTIRTHTRVTGIETQNGRVTAVIHEKGRISTRTVVSCAGPQSTYIGQLLGITIPTASARLELMATAPLAPLFKVGLVTNGLYIRQAQRGNILFGGGPHEWTDVRNDVEPAKPNTPLLSNIARRFVQIFPSIAHTMVIRCWAGISDVTPDFSSVIDRLPTPEGFVLAITSGHGFGLSPIIAKVICALALGKESPISIEPLSLSRFTGLSDTWRVERNWEAGAYNT
jgi:sarcosine oxidase subunit beta